MEERAESIRVFRPQSLSTLLKVYNRNPRALLFAGGTEIMPHLRDGGKSGPSLREGILCLGQVRELARIFRYPRVLDIGACLPIARILEAGRYILSPLLLEALQAIGNPAVRNLATLGGNICSRSPLADSLPALSVLEAQLELRSLAGSRWLKLRQFFAVPGSGALNPGELVTRIRIPLESWDFQLFRKVSGRITPGRSLVSCAAAARLGKGALEAFRLSLGGVGNPLFRSPALEAQLEGSRLPVPARAVEALVSELDKTLRPLLEGRIRARYTLETALRLLRWCLERLNEKSLETL